MSKRSNQSSRKPQKSPPARPERLEALAPPSAALPALLTNAYNLNYNPDVLTCLANLSNDEVFTPPELANKMLDLLPAELWRDKNATFLDPVTKSGIFLREIAKRLNAGLAAQIPDAQQRINHIFTQQLFGIAITELTALLARRSLYCAKHANSPQSICTAFAADNAQGNILFRRTEHRWQAGKCRDCGASEAVYERDAALETHAYPFIHTDTPQALFGADMRFDVIIGNPPYQLDTGGSGRQARPIYQEFIAQAKKLNPRFLSMIIPSRWFAGGMGLNEFREEMLSDTRVQKIVDFVDARDCFPSVDIAGGVCYFLWSKDYSGLCTTTSHFKGKTQVFDRKLNEFSTFIRFGEAVSVVRKVEKLKEKKLTGIISATRPFGLKTSDRPTGKGELHLLSSGGSGKIPKSRVTAGFEMIEKWKLVTSKTSHDHAGQPDKEGMRRIISRLEILEPNYICTESYIVMGAFSNRTETENLNTYVKSKFLRFLTSLLSYSQDITRERFAFVPMQDFTEPWTDEKLYKKYGLTTEEIAFIESMIRPMDLASAELDPTAAVSDGNVDSDNDE
jgi:site-specific DNA-methyltransferase (adenine-specific)